MRRAVVVRGNVDEAEVAPIVDGGEVAAARRPGTRIHSASFGIARAATVLKIWLCAFCRIRGYWCRYGFSFSMQLERHISLKLTAKIVLA